MTADPETNSGRIPLFSRRRGRCRTDGPFGSVEIDRRSGARPLLANPIDC
jgi:hypothetical protein